MTPYLTTDSIIDTIKQCEREKTSLEKNPFNQFSKKEELRKLNFSIAANFSLLHEFYPAMNGITNIEVFDELNNAGLLPKRGRSSVKGSPIEPI